MSDKRSLRGHSFIINDVDLDEYSLRFERLLFLLGAPEVAGDYHEEVEKHLSIPRPEILAYNDSERIYKKNNMQLFEAVSLEEVESESNRGIDTNNNFSDGPAQAALKRRRKNKDLFEHANHIQQVKQKEYKNMLLNMEHTIVPSKPIIATNSTEKPLKTKDTDDSGTSPLKSKDTKNSENNKGKHENAEKNNEDSYDSKTSTELTEVELGIMNELYYEKKCHLALQIKILKAFLHITLLLSSMETKNKFGINSNKSKNIKPESSNVISSMGNITKNNGMEKTLSTSQSNFSKDCDFIEYQLPGHIKAFKKPKIKK
ncbi:hypothetical protein BB559_005852 [Furculomyces boomerangus]|uniref:Uncharacterized protein n=1 Tax=Furculomyces boomerangus TaxID=61424 RepID=A0A2T9Y6B3_9FUNG|nr:hypothetical protein BB559_005852 [Furculomyces boomerangus]